MAPRWATDRDRSPESCGKLFWRTRHQRNDPYGGLVPSHIATAGDPADWDNTLVDSWSTIHEALNFLMAAMDKPLWTIEETRERVRLSLREAFPRIFGERWEEAATSISTDSARSISNC